VPSTSGTGSSQLQSGTLLGAGVSAQMKSKAGSRCSLWVLRRGSGLAWSFENSTPTGCVPVSLPTGSVGRG